MARFFDAVQEDPINTLVQGLNKTGEQLQIVVNLRSNSSNVSALNAVKDCIKHITNVLNEEPKLDVPSPLPSSQEGKDLEDTVTYQPSVSSPGN